MARPQRRRRICREPEYRHFQPDGITQGGEVNLTCDEFEIIRLVDHLGLTHEQAAKRMDISRTTATECYESARRKIAEAIVTTGGVKVSEVDPKTMESKLVAGLYFAGEIIDCDAYTGGFNLQIAWATAYAAGMAVKNRD